MHNNKRRPNNGGNGGQQNRHNNNRPRRFGSGGGQRSHDDSTNVARQRRNATQSREKYQMMARDAMSMGDRVLAENYLQHADHYYRVLMALPPEEVRQPYQQRGSNDMPENGASAGSEHGESHDDGMPPMADIAPQAASHALPAFITQPVPPENLPE